MSPTQPSVSGAQREPQPKSGRDPRASLSAYHALSEQVRDADLERRRSSYPTLVNHFYDVVTDFYEFAWGQSFHFAPRKRGETFAASLVRHQHYLAEKLELRPGMRFLDIGCGVGGPLQEIARFSGATGIGLNNNAYQISRGQAHVADAGLEDRCSFLKANFMEIPLPDGDLDVVYATEAICHAPDKAALFAEIFRVLKPGGRFGAYEWCVTRHYDASDPNHLDIARRIELGNGVARLESMQEEIKKLEGAGFELVETQDRAADSDPEMPWFRALQGRDLSLASLARIPIGRSLTAGLTKLLEGLRLAPPGTGDAARLLNLGADALVEGGTTGIFTPMFFFLARKT